MTFSMKVKLTKYIFTLKFLVIILWCIAISLFLYYFVVANELNKPATFAHYLNFLILLFGSSFAYHITTLLIATPETSNNKKEWIKVLGWLAVTFAGYIIAGVLVISGISAGNLGGFILALVGLIIGYIIVINTLVSLIKPVLELLKTNKI